MFLQILNLILTCFIDISLSLFGFGMLYSKGRQVCTPINHLNNQTTLTWAFLYLVGLKHVTNCLLYLETILLEICALFAFHNFDVDCFIVGWDLNI